jgi:hypothetical protein
MFTHGRPTKRRTRKPVTKTLAKQFKSEDRLRKFDRAMFAVFSVMGLILLFEAI